MIGRSRQRGFPPCGGLVIGGLLIALTVGAAWAAGEPRPEPYVIGVEDVLDISMPDHPELAAKVPVRPDGKISLPLVDEVLAAGLTPMDLKESLESAYRPFVTVPNISVMVSEVNSRKVFVLGKVATPGAFPIVRPTRLLQAIALAGGFQEFAKMDRVVLLRDTGDGEERIQLNLKRLLRGQESDANILLLPGDTVIVP